jgi:DNA polymerase I-like protein with 3'-5' exonuclease and polymerase domains
MKIAIIDKAPSKNNYSNWFKFDFELFHMSSVPIAKLLKKDVDLDIDTDLYDLVILVGSEATKEYAKITSVTNYAGQLVHDKFVPISNPAMLIFKPEGKQDFQRAVDRIHKYTEGVVSNAAKSGDFKGIDTVQEAKEFLLEVFNSDAAFVALDTETTGLYPRDGHVLGLSISYKLRHGRYVLSDALDDECLEILQAILNRYVIVFHNLKFDVKMIEFHLGVKVCRAIGRIHDTMVMHYNLDESDSHSLKALALKYTEYGDYDSELDTYKKQYCSLHNILLDDFTYDLIPFDIISTYASIDTAVTLEVFYKFWPIVQANAKLLSVYNNLLIPGTLFLMDMEEVGIPIDKERMKAADKYLETEVHKAKESLYSFEAIKQYESDAGTIFNPNSVQQIRKVLFDYVGLTPTGKLTKAGAISTDAEVLEELAEEHPLPKTLLTMRQLGKVRNTYISKILPELDRDERIRTNFNLIFTTSGRLSSSGKFNAQQIPRDDPIIKGCIKAPDGYVIVSQDLTTAEMYYAAVLSGDANLMQVFSSGGDFHSTIAKMVFNLPCHVDEVKKLFPAMRQSAKAISFGILYGSGAKKVSETVTKATGEYYSLSQAQDDITAYFTKFAKLKKWLKDREAFIRANGFTYSFFGRKRRLPNVFSDDKGIAAHEVRSGINAEVQSLASDMNLLGAMDTAFEIKQKGLEANIFMLVHDSVVSIVREDQVEEYCEILKRNTQKDRGCSIPKFPVGVDQDVGKDYSFGKFESYYSFDGDMLSRI